MDIKRRGKFIYNNDGKLVGYIVYPKKFKYLIGDIAIIHNITHNSEPETRREKIIVKWLSEQYEIPDTEW